MGMLQLLIKIYERLEGRFRPLQSWNCKSYRTISWCWYRTYGCWNITTTGLAIFNRRWRESRDVAPLPNLDFKFVCANSLIPLDDSKADLFNDPELHKQLAEIRQTYFNARKPHTKKAAQTKYYKLAGSNTGLFDNLRTTQLKSFDPFINSHAVEFFDSDQMFGIENGFDIVMGNPPYIHLEKMKDVANKLYKPLGFRRMNHVETFMHFSTKWALRTSRSWKVNLYYIKQMDACRLRQKPT